MRKYILPAILTVLLVVGIALAWRSQTRFGAQDVLAASAEGNAAKVRAILRRQPELANARDPGGMTALHLAVRHGRVPVADVLLKNGADPNARNSRGLVPLHLTAYSPSPTEPMELAALLIAHKADVNAASRRGYTPLHLAIFMDREPLARFLLDHGANPNARNEAGHTALQFAERVRNDKLIKVLREHGAKELPDDHRSGNRAGDRFDRWWFPSHGAPGHAPHDHSDVMR